MDFATVATFVSTKLIPAFNAVMGQLPALLSTEEADVQSALQAIQKTVSDLQVGLAELVAAVKASQP